MTRVAAYKRNFGSHPERRLKLAVLAGMLPLLAFFIVFTYGCGPSAPDNSATPNASNSTTAQPGNTSQVEGVIPDPNLDYSTFRHDTEQHERLPCLVCHVRDENTVSMKFPGHIPCSSCHVQQFADNQNAICTICHTETGLKDFPPLRSFKAVFDHATHLQQTNCATCHKPAARGVALSIPSRANAHATCFQCHGPDTVVEDRNIGSCSTCHQPGQPVRTSQRAKAFDVNFSHAEHTRTMNCSACHTVLAGMETGRQVTSPVALMHRAPPGSNSCAACHNNKRAFGGTDFSDCRRCHEGSGFGF